MFSWFRKRRRRKLLAEPFPSWWDVILRKNVRHYLRLSGPEQLKLRDLTRILVAEKSWEGCGGLFVTDEIKITIAAQASLLLLGMKHDYYSRVDSIVVYPTSFRTPNPEDDWEDDELSDRFLSGEAVYRGPVILAWSDVLPEGRYPDEGSNVVIHEFAHQLDFLDDVINGTPPLNDPVLEKRWAVVMQAALADHRNALERGWYTIFTVHAAQDETEFFADASEAFYCRPKALYRKNREVFELLKSYYRVNPLLWTDPE